MGNISDWCVVGISKKTSSKNPNSYFYVVSCIRENDSLYAGKNECRCFLVNDRGFDAGISVGSFVSYFGDLKGFGFLRKLPNPKKD